MISSLEVRRAEGAKTSSPKRSVKIRFGHALTSQQKRRATIVILTHRPDDGKSAAVYR